MDYLDLEAPGLTAGNVEKIAALFPAAVTETRGADGKVKRPSTSRSSSSCWPPTWRRGRSRYEFTWVGKRAAMAEAAAPPPEPSAP